MLANQKMVRSFRLVTVTAESHTTSGDCGRELHLKTKARVEKEMRNELLGKGKIVI